MTNHEYINIAKSYGYNVKVGLNNTRRVTLYRDVQLVWHKWMSHREFIYFIEDLQNSNVIER